MSRGDFPESLRQAMLVGRNVGREIGRSLMPAARCPSRTQKAPDASEHLGRGQEVLTV